MWVNVDVKGFVRSAIPPLLNAGVAFLSINANGHPGKGGGPQPAAGSRNASMFRWRDPPSNRSLTVLFHDSYAHRFQLDSSGRLATDASEALVAGGVAL